MTVRKSVRVTVELAGGVKTVEDVEGRLETEKRTRGPWATREAREAQLWGRVARGAREPG